MQDRLRDPFSRRTADPTVLVPWLVELGRTVPGLVRSYLPGGPIDARTREQVILAVTEVNGCRYCAWIHGSWADYLGEADDPAEITEALLTYARACAEAGEPLDTAPLADVLPHEAIQSLRATVAQIEVANLVGNTVDGLSPAATRKRPLDPPRALGELATVAVAIPIAVPMLAVGGAMLLRRVAPDVPVVEMPTAGEANLLVHLLARAVPSYLANAGLRLALLRLPAPVVFAVQAGRTAATLRIGRGRIALSNGVAPDAMFVVEGDVEPLLQLATGSLVRRIGAARQAAVGGTVRAALAELVGPEHVHDPADWLEDITEHPPGTAELTVTPGTRDEVVAILRWAAAEQVSITPVVAGYNVAGIAIPQGGIVLDLKRLDGLEVDEDTMTVIVEPGVTFEQLKAHLDEHHPDLAYTYPFAPPFTSVLMNALLDGLNNLSLPGGAMGRWLTGVEAVLADGTVVRTGTGGVVDGWFARAPLPDLTGLFVSTQGTTGIVLRGGLALVPKAPHRSRWFAFCWSLDYVQAAMRALARTRSVDDVGCMTWPSAKLLFGATHDLVRAPDEPMAFLFIDLTGASAAELAARQDLARGILADAGVDPPFEVAHLVKLMPGMAKLAELPTTLDFLLDFPGGGLAWVGSYGPPATWVAGAEAGLAVLERHGFPPFLVARPMEGGRYHVLRYVACFDRADEEEVGRVRSAMAELADVVLDHGYVPYKASADAARRIIERADPGWVALLTRVRDALDPERRMNPGRWPGT